MVDNFRGNPADEEQFKFDPFAHSVTIISENHRLIHDGMFYTYTHTVASLANSASVEFIIAVPAGVFPHWQQFQINAESGGLDIVSTEGVTTSDDGTVVTAINRNRNSSRQPGAVITHTPTGVSGGSLQDESFVPGSSTDEGSVALLWDERRAGEFVLAADTKYHLEVTNNSGAAMKIQFKFSMYEIDYDQ